MIMKNEKLKKILKIVSNVLLYAFIVVFLAMTIFIIISNQSNDGAISVFGHQMRTVISPSMDACELTDVSKFEIKSLPVNTMVFIEEVPEDKEARSEWYSNLKVGDVLTFKYVTSVRQEVITHRVTDIKENGIGGYYITLRGDNISSVSGALVQIINTSQDEVSTNFIIGKVVGSSYAFGSFVSFLKSKVGLIVVIIIPTLIIIFFEVIRLYKLVTKDKKEKEKQMMKEQQDELEELKKRLALLEGQNKSEGSDD